MTAIFGVWKECLVTYSYVPHLYNANYGSETWAMGKQGENLLRSSERKFYRKYLARYLKMDDGGGAKSLNFIRFVVSMM